MYVQNDSLSMPSRHVHAHAHAHAHVVGSMELRPARVEVILPSVVIACLAATVRVVTTSVVARAAMGSGVGCVGLCWLCGVHVAHRVCDGECRAARALRGARVKA